MVFDAMTFSLHSPKSENNHSNLDFASGTPCTDNLPRIAWASKRGLGLI